MANENLTNFGRVATRDGRPVRVPVSTLVTDDVLRASAISKLNTPTNSNQRRFDKSNEESTLPLIDIQAISDINKNRVRDLDNIVKLFPDLEMVVQIFVSLIQAPKDMTTTTLLYKVDNDFFPPAVSTSLIEIAKKCIEDYHKIPEQNNQLLREAIFETGSYISAVLPESVIDEVINSDREVSKESLSTISDDGKFFKGLGYLGDPTDENKTLGLESFYQSHNTRNVTEKTLCEKFGEETVDLGYSITDNWNVLKLPLVMEHARNQTKHQLLQKSLKRPAAMSITGRQVSAESAGQRRKFKLSDGELEKTLYRRGDTSSTLFQAIPSPDNTRRRSIGRPLRLKIPSEAGVPVHLPGKEDEHLGLFVLIDEEGNAISAATESKRTAQTLSQFHSQDMTQNSGSSNNNPLATNLVARAKKNLQGNEEQPLLTEVTQIYSSIFERNLMQSLRKGVYGKGVEIGDVTEAARLMLARQLANRQTRVLFIPKELVTYYAFKFHPNGVGKSALDDMRYLSGLRASVMMTRIVAMAKNAIGTTKVNLTFDEDDQNVTKTAERVRHEVLRMNQMFIPVGYTSHEDIADWMSRIGTMFSYKNHPDYPNMDIEFEAVQGIHEVPDGELDEELRRMMYMGFGIAPEIVDQGFSGDFVTTAVMNNALMNKRIQTYQHRFGNLLTDEAKKLLRHDAVVMNEIVAILKENKASIDQTLEDSIKAEYTGRDEELYEELAREFVDSLVISLPLPETRTLESQKEAFDKFVECIDATIEHWISNNCIPAELVGETNAKTDFFLEAYKSYLIRNWMSDNNFLPEIAEIATKDKDGNPSMMLIEAITSHAQQVASSLLKSSQESLRFIAAANKDLNKIENPTPEEPQNPGDASPPQQGGEQTQGQPGSSQPSEGGATASMSTSDVREGAGDAGDSDKGAVSPNNFGL